MTANRPVINMFFRTITSKNCDFGSVHLYQGHDAISALAAFGITFLGAIYFSWMYVEPKKGKIIYRGSTHRNAIPSPLAMLPFNPRKANISFGFMIMAVSRRPMGYDNYLAVT